MAIFEITSDRLRRIDPTTFGAAGVRERDDLQRLLREQVEVVAPDVLVIAEEFGEWEDCRRRIDLLGVDRNANIVVVELKRTEDGGHMELQAVRYAAMVSAMTFDRAADVYAAHLLRLGRTADARADLLAFLGWVEPDEDRFGQDVRVVLVSAEFSRELTTTVMWLNERGLDLRCVRMRPYQDGPRLLVDVQQVIPLPEAADYVVRLKEKEVREQAARRERSTSADAFLRFWTAFLPRAKARTDLHARATPKAVNWVGAREPTGVGQLIYVAGPKVTPRVELYIDGGDGEANKRAFDRLAAGRADVEARFGGPLAWERLDHAQVARVKHEVPGFSFREEGGWDALQDAMIDAMVRLERALRPPLGREDGPGDAGQ
ncbi:MAG: hypothetical protein JWO31_1150 [Phycisphaerales bacterium]|nr:hypothetical protein [Phycisphaerales bacterium]